jgi:transposase-like protein
MGAVPGVLYADGTKCKSISADGHSCKGDVKVLLGVRNEGTVFPIGTWTGHETWQNISDQLAKRQVKFPDGTILICDGEIGLAESLSKLASDEQRCQWHIHRDLYHMMRLNGGKIKDVRPMQERLRGIMAIELPKESFSLVPEDQKASITAKMVQAEKDLDMLINDIRLKGYTAAVNYLERAKHAMFGYVRRWLALGLVCPRASSFIERTMRAIGRRIKKLGYNWKDEGVGKIARIVLKLFATEGEWEEYWRKRMDLNQSVMLSFKVLKVR